MGWQKRGSLKGLQGERGPQGPAGRDGVAVQLDGYAAFHVDEAGDLWCETAGAGACPFELDQNGDLFVEVRG